MRKNINKLIFILIFFSSYLFASGELTKKQLDQFDNIQMFKKINAKIIGGYDLESLYMLKIKIDENIFISYLTKDKKMFIDGKIINASTGDLITPPVNLKKTLNKEALTFGEGKDEYIVFTDTQCPYCKKFKSYFKQLEKKIKLRIFYFPLSFHEEAANLAIYIMSKKTNKEKIATMLRIDKDSKEFKNRKISKKELATLNNKLKEQMNIANELGITGTPTIFDKNGQTLSWVTLVEKYGIEIQK